MVSHPSVYGLRCTVYRSRSTVHGTREGRLTLQNGYVRLTLRDAMRMSDDPAIGPPPMLRVAKQSPGVGGTVVQQRMGGRDVAPLGADVRVSRDTRRVSGSRSPKSLRDVRGP